MTEPLQHDHERVNTCKDTEILSAFGRGKDLMLVRVMYSYVNVNN